jgi:hypothetical protein
MMNFVKIIETSLDSIGRRLPKFLRLGKSDVQECFQVSSFGDDSNPVKDMVAVYGQTSEIGKNVIIGYINKNQISEPGEKRIFSTDENGEVVFYFHLKNDGTAELNGTDDNLVRFSALESGFNELKGDLNDMISKWNSFVTAYVPGSPTTVGLPPTLSGQNVTASTADISDSKIDEITTS